MQASYNLKKKDLPVVEINQKRMAAATRLTKFSRRITLWPNFGLARAAGSMQVK
jgi:hypothetical protein